MPQMSQVLRERAIGTLTAGMSTRAVSPWIECSFLHHKPSPKAFQRIWQYIHTAPQTQTTCNHTSPGPPHPASSPPRSSETDTRTAAATIGLHNQRISAQTVRNRLREAHLHARHPHRGLDLTAVRRRNRLEWENAHIWWRLALWRGVLFTDESRFSLYRADGRQCVLLWTLWIEWPMVAVGLWYGQAYVMDNKHRSGAFYWWHFEFTEIPWQDSETHCCAIYPRPSPHVAAW